MNAEILAAIASLREEMKAGFDQLNRRMDDMDKRLDDLQEDIRVLVQESHDAKKEINRIKRTNAG